MEVVFLELNINSPLSFYSYEAIERSFLTKLMENRQKKGLFTNLSAISTKV